jgi:hypothetical protein
VLYSILNCIFNLRHLIYIQGRYRLIPHPVANVSQRGVYSFFESNSYLNRIPKNTAIRKRYTDKEFLFYLYCDIAKNVPQRIPFPDATIPTNEIKLDLVAVQ